MTERTPETKDMITITRKEYNDLLESSAWLQALENAGVDNWDGIDFARELYEEENNIEIEGDETNGEPY